MAGFETRWGIDTRQSHIGYYLTGYAYKHLVNVTNTNTMRYEKTPRGVFYCKEVSPYQYTTNDLGEVIQVKVGDVSIETPDFIGTLESNDRVVFNGQKYIVLSVQKRLKLKQERFGKRPSAVSIIALRGGEEKG